jgi:hypothetical protein
MATTDARPTAGARRRAAANNDDDLDFDLDPEREEQFDLLTAAVIGMAVGAGIALLIRRGPSGIRPIVPVMGAVGTGARLAGGASLRGARWAGDTLEPAARWAGKRAKRGGRWAREHGEELAEQLPSVDDVTDVVREYLDAAREAINDTVERETRGLRKAIRRQRKRVGV